MLDGLTLLLSALIVFGILLPAALIYAFSLLAYLLVVMPLTHLYRLGRYGIQSNNLEAV